MSREPFDLKAKNKKRDLPGDPDSWPGVKMNFRYSDPKRIRMKADAYFGEGLGGDCFISSEEFLRGKEKLSIRVARQGGPIHYSPGSYCLAGGGEIDIDRLHAIAVILYHRRHPSAAKSIGQLAELLISERSAEKAAQGFELLAEEIRDKSRASKRKRAALPVYQVALDHIIEFRTIPTKEILGGRCKALGVGCKTFYDALKDIGEDLGVCLTRGYNS